MRQREELRLEIEDTIRRFEPRFLTVNVVLAPAHTALEATLRLRIDALLHAEPAPEPALGSEQELLARGVRMEPT